MMAGSFVERIQAMQHLQFAEPMMVGRIDQVARSLMEIPMYGQ